MAALSAATSADGTAVVIKRMRPELCFDSAYQQLFEDEGNLAERLDHPNIVRLIDRGEDDCGPFLVFERVDGTDLGVALDAHMHEHKPMELPAVLGVFIPLMRALHAAHEARGDDGQPLGLVHRDVSPGNVLLSDDGDVKLADFGVAKSALKTDATVAGEMKGKFAYMAPEQTHGGAIDRRADIFAAGIVLYECLTGQRLFDGPTDADVVHAVRTHEPDDPSASNPDLDDELMGLLGAMLAKAPADRPATAAEVADALYEVAVGRCLETGLRRHVARLAQDHPRKAPTPLSPMATDTPRRRTQRVVNAELSARRRRPSGPRLVPWIAAALVLGGVSATASMVWGDRDLAPERTPLVVERLPDAEDDASPARELPSMKVGGEASPSEPPPPDPPTTEVAAARQRTVTTTTVAPPRKRAPSPAPTGQRRTSKPVDKPVRVASATDGFGKLFLNAKPWAKVAIDGAPLEGHTPIMGLRLPAGPHLVTLTNPVYQFKKTVKIDVPKHGEVRRIVDLTKR